MKKKKSGGGGANWMDTYGDMVTLLLCFFVLLYSMSTISEEKWRAIVTSFNPRASQTPTATPGTDGPNADLEDQGGDPTAVPTPDPLVDQEEIDTMIQELFESLKAYSQEEGMENTLAVEMIGGKVYVTFNETAFFSGDSSALRPAAQEVLTRVCTALDQVGDAVEEILVQGHTAQASANQRNNVRKDRMLASNRATEVVIFLQENSSIHPARLLDMGCGQWRPISSNATAETRALNRRVEMVISGRNLEEELEGKGALSYITKDEMDYED